MILPRGVWFIKPAPKEVMPVFSRPYLKKDSTGHCRNPRFGVYLSARQTCAHGTLSIFFILIKPQILVCRPAYQGGTATLQNRYGLEKTGMTGLGRSFKAKPLNCDPRNTGVFSVKINFGLLGSGRFVFFKVSPRCNHLPPQHARSRIPYDQDG